MSILLKVIIGVFFSSASLLYLFQLVLRNFFHISLLWSEPLIQYLFLIAGLLGAAVASEKEENIKIDIFKKLSSHKSVRIIKHIFCLAVTAMITWVFSRQLEFDAADSASSAFRVKNWILDIPYIVIFLLSAVYYIRHIITDLQRTEGSR
ncbi:MAG: hypothetical protein A2096_17910 [Spirochaetes bacterium GWF1_41_5]|nr:MAG: hypothetical protein A2096_17910 [Spirochaetes bacterium GWF1_41_5]HBE04561.1 hypothetical protein [Spirochaetia bacterium]